MPAVTVGLPVYNGEDLIGEALEALLGQTFRNVEFLVSDNASTDRTPAIVESFAARDSRVRLIRQPHNLGALPNFRFVLEEARADLFCWRAHDDLSDPNWLEVLHGALTSRPDCALAVSSVQRLNPDGSESRRSPYPELDDSAHIVRVVKLLRLARAPWIYGLFRRHELARCLDVADLHFPRVWGQDHATVLPLLLADRITGSGAACFYQRRTPKGSSYRPTRLSDRWALDAELLAYATRALWQSPLRAWEKAVVGAFLLPYVNRKGEKFSRLVRSTLAWPFQSAIGEGGGA